MRPRLCAALLWGLGCGPSVPSVAIDPSLPADVDYAGVLFFDADDVLVGASGLSLRSEEGRFRLSVSALDEDPEWAVVVGYPSAQIRAKSPLSDRDLGAVPLTLPKPWEPDLGTPLYFARSNLYGDQIKPESIEPFPIGAPWLRPCPGVLSQPSNLLVTADCVGRCELAISAEAECAFEIRGASCSLGEIRGKISGSGETYDVTASELGECQGRAPGAGALFSLSRDQPGAPLRCAFDAYATPAPEAFDLEILDLMQGSPQIGTPNDPPVLGRAPAMRIVEGEGVVSILGGFVRGTKCEVETDSTLAFFDPTELRITRTATAAPCLTHLATRGSELYGLFQAPGAHHRLARFGASGQIGASIELTPPPELPRLDTMAVNDLTIVGDRAFLVLASADPNYLVSVDLTTGVMSLGPVDADGHLTSIGDHPTSLTTDENGRLIIVDFKSDYLYLVEPATLLMVQSSELSGVCGIGHMQPVTAVADPVTDQYALLTNDDGPELNFIDRETRRTCAPAAYFEAEAEGHTLVQAPWGPELVVGLFGTSAGARFARSDWAGRRLHVGSKNLSPELGPPKQLTPFGQDVVALLPWSAQVVRLRPR